MKRKYIHYILPWVVGLYYQENNTFYHNDDCRGGKVIVVVPARKDKGRKAVK